MVEDRPFSCRGKLVLLDGKRYAECKDEGSAFYIAMACNGLHDVLPHIRENTAEGLPA